MPLSILEKTGQPAWAKPELGPVDVNRRLTDV